jgi:hypothetical protein
MWPSLKEDVTERGGDADVLTSLAGLRYYSLTMSAPSLTPPTLAQVP